MGAGGGAALHTATRQAQTHFQTPPRLPRSAAGSRRRPAAANPAGAAASSPAGRSGHRGSTVGRCAPQLCEFAPVSLGPRQRSAPAERLRPGQCASLGWGICQSTAPALTRPGQNQRVPTHQPTHRGTDRQAAGVQQGDLAAAGRPGTGTCFGATASPGLRCLNLFRVRMTV